MPFVTVNILGTVRTSINPEVENSEAVAAEMSVLRKSPVWTIYLSGDGTIGQICGKAPLKFTLGACPSFLLGASNDTGNRPTKLSMHGETKYLRLGERTAAERGRAVVVPVSLWGETQLIQIQHGRRLEVRHWLRICFKDDHLVCG